MSNALRVSSNNSPGDFIHGDRYTEEGNGKWWSFLPKNSSYSLFLSIRFFAFSFFPSFSFFFFLFFLSEITPVYQFSNGAFQLIIHRYVDTAWKAFLSSLMLPSSPLPLIVVALLLLVSPFHNGHDGTWQPRRSGLRHCSSQYISVFLLFMDAYWSLVSHYREGIVYICIGFTKWCRYNYSLSLVSNKTLPFCSWSHVTSDAKPLIGYVMSFSTLAVLNSWFPGVSGSREAYFFYSFPLYLFLASHSRSQIISANRSISLLSK